jgi:hypothetical protein
MKRTYFTGTDQEKIDNLRQDNDRLKMTVSVLCMIIIVMLASFWIWAQ